MSLELKISTTHLITVTNVLNTAGNTPAAASVVASVYNHAGDQIATVNLNEAPAGTHTGNLAPVMAENEEYTIEVAVTADGALKTYRSSFKAEYTELS